MNIKVLLFCLLLPITLIANEFTTDEKFTNEPSAEIQKVRDYILNEEYPELFGDDSYRTTVNDIHSVDFGFNGLIEVVVLFKPHYLQSPTIVIYQIQKDGTVKRIREGLAPGPLIKRGEYLLDSHSLGKAVDFTVNEKPISTEESRKFAIAATDKSGFGLLVQYRDFFHADSRSGNGSYIDMTLSEPFSGSKNCADFEFSQVDMIKVGYKKDNKKIGLITAIVKDKMYIYEIHAITADGFLEKKMSVKKS